jgi:hypothetical protein
MSCLGARGIESDCISHLIRIRRLSTTVVKVLEEDPSLEQANKPANTRSFFPILLDQGARVLLLVQARETYGRLDNKWLSRNERATVDVHRFRVPKARPPYRSVSSPRLDFARLFLGLLPNAALTYANAIFYLSRNLRNI